MKRMSYIAEVKLADSVNEILNDIRHGTSPEDAVIKVASAQKIAPAKVARLCEATNKIMSIHYLSFADSSKKASSFDLVDTQEVLRRLRDTSKLEKNPIKFKKTASEGLSKISEINALRNLYALSSKDRAQLDIGTLKAKVANNSIVTDEALNNVDTAESYTKRAEADCELSMQALVDKVKSLGNTDAEDLANYISATYGEEGKVLIKTLSDIINGSEDAKKPILNPTIKEGSAWVSTNKEVHKLVDNFMEKVNYYTQSKIMHQQAMKIAADGISEAVQNISRLSEAAKELSVDEYSAKAISPFSLKMERKFNDLDVKDTFTNIYLGDEFLRSYEPKVVRDAYNATMQAVPGLIKRKNSEALIKALVKRIVTTNSQIDPLEVGSFIDMNQHMADTELKTMQSNLQLASALKKTKDS